MIERTVVQLPQEAVMGPIRRQRLHDVKPAVVGNEPVVVQIIHQICDLREALAFHKRGSAFYINGVIFGFSHGREPLQLLLFWSFAHGGVIIIS